MTYIEAMTYIRLRQKMTDIEDLNQKCRKSEFYNDVYWGLVAKTQRRKTETTHIEAT